LPGGFCWGSSACAESANSARADANERTIRDRLDVFILVPPSCAVPWRSSVRLGMRNVDAIGRIADQPVAICPVKNR
jgi:hypothetical protein